MVSKCAPNAHDLNNLASLEVQTHMQTLEVLHGPVLLRAGAIDGAGNGNGWS